jgi:hypothetical protein
MLELDLLLDAITESPNWSPSPSDRYKDKDSPLGLRLRLLGALSAEGRGSRAYIISGMYVLILSACLRA